MKVLLDTCVWGGAYSLWKMSIISLENNKRSYKV